MFEEQKTSLGQYIELRIGESKYLRKIESNTWTSIKFFLSSLYLYKPWYVKNVILLGLFICQQLLIIR